MTNGYIKYRIKGKQVYKHRVVMEKFLCRKLRRDEHVHHKNENRKDNRIENLELVSIAEHNSIHKTKPKRPCASNGCKNYQVKKGYCNTHYQSKFRRKERNIYMRKRYWLNHEKMKTYKRDWYRKKHNALPRELRKRDSKGRYAPHANAISPDLTTPASL